MSEAYRLLKEGSRLLEARDYPAAVDALERAVALEPTARSIHETLGRAYLAARRYRRGADQLAIAVELAPTDGFAHYLLARCLDRLGDPQADRHYRLASCFGTGLD